ncbi:MAG: exodeoxyribonuclease V subunit alpha [Colwellia sp.]|nr:exodeoxyribonuclease V subunit alpha [Colwellia sp.]
MVEQSQITVKRERSVNTMNKPIYSHFNQVKDTILGIEAIDYFFAKEMLTALTTDKVAEVTVQENLYHLFLALSASLRAGHSCLPLPEVAEQHWGKGFAVHPAHDDAHTVANTKSNGQGDEQAVTVLQDTKLSHAGFIFAGLTQLQNMLAELNIQPVDGQLLVLEHDNLYLRRYFQFEYDLGQAINNRLAQHCQFDNGQIRQCIAALFPDEAKQEVDSLALENVEVDWQKIAVANAINKNFSVIAGGPGTGKTYTVTKLLAALVMLEQLKQALPQDHSALAQQHEQHTPLLNIALVAPTGKAAQRLSESIVNAISGFSGLIDDKVLAEIPTQAQTIHRLLGVLPNSPNFKHQEDNRLAYDIVLIDEVSMVDLPLMTRIFRALKDNTKVILLGDADQLPSVAAGSVLADIAPRPHGGFSNSNNDYLGYVCQLSAKQLKEAFPERTVDRTVEHAVDRTAERNESFDYLTFLVKSRRFDGKGGIGLIANGVIQGDVNRSWKLLSNAHRHQDNQLILAQGELASWLAPLVKQYYQPIESCQHVSDAFALLAQFRVLCATRKGDYGVEQLNEVIKSYLGKNNSPYQQNQQALYHGQPIMINENDYRLGLYNGDIGIIWRVFDKEGKTHLLACFEDSTKPIEGAETAQSGIRQILPSRLPKFESVYAMTIHKTQGSEFSHVAMVLSATQSDNSTAQGKTQRGSKLLSRELLYTGITRAKKLLTIATNQRIWNQGVPAQVKRHSGLTLCAKGEK